MPNIDFASLASTLSGMDAQTLSDALLQQQQAEMSQRTSAATNAAQSAGQEYQQAAAAPPPTGDPNSDFVDTLLGNISSVIARDPSFRENAHQKIKDEHSALLQARAQNLQALRDVWNQRAEAAQKAGDLEAEQKARDKIESLSNAHAKILETQRHDNAMTLQKLKGEQEMAQIKAKPAGGGGVYAQAFSQTDPSAIADGIIKGDLPPSLTQYSRIAQGPVASILAKKGFALGKAQQDFSAVTRHFATLNGRMQLQVRQSANTVTRGLDDVESLAKRLAELSPQTRNTPINKLIVKGTREWGLLSPEAQDVATELNGQVATLIPELSNIYSAGGVPSDKAMQLAEKVIHSEWPLNRILAGVSRERANIQYRVNSINNVGPVTPSSVGGGGFEPAAEQTGPISVDAPNGKTYHFKTQKQADVFKKRAGIQ